MAARSSSGAPMSVASARAPAPVTVRSTESSSEPLRAPAAVQVSSRLSRVAASIAIVAPEVASTGAWRNGIAPVAACWR